MLSELLRRVRETAPLIHSITNYVTANDCANILLAVGASPIMADDPDEAAEITALCGGLNINIGTLNRQKIPAMMAAGKKAAELGHPIVLDPVGAGASELRTRTALELMERIPFTVIRGNISETKALAVGGGHTKGVDADAGDLMTPEEAQALVKGFAAKAGAVVAVTGATDMVTDGETVYRIRNGHPDMARVTGTGCQLSALIAAFVTANPGQPLQATAAAVIAMGVCGEIARRRMSPSDGNASYRNYIIDAAYNLSGEALEQGARYEVR